MLGIHKRAARRQDQHSEHCKVRHKKLLISAPSALAPPFSSQEANNFGSLLRNQKGLKAETRYRAGTPAVPPSLPHLYGLLNPHRTPHREADLPQTAVKLPPQPAPRASRGAAQAPQAVLWGFAQRSAVGAGPLAVPSRPHRRSPPPAVAAAPAPWLPGRQPVSRAWSTFPPPPPQPRI